MSNFGRTFGNVAQGYYRGRNQAEDLEERYEDQAWKNNRRERELANEEYYDPIQREAAGIGLESARRKSSFDEYADPYQRRGLERGDRMGAMAIDDAEFSQPIRRRGLERADRAGQSAEEDYEYRRPLERRALERGDRAGQRAEEDADFSRPYDRRGIERQDQAGQRAEAQGVRANKVDEALFQDFERGQGAEEYYRSAKNALANFAANGNPVALEDFYNNMYPDDGTVKIERLPDGTYKGTYGDGRTSTATKEELQKGSEALFMQHPSLNDAGAGAGYGAGGYGVRTGGIGGRRGAGGYGGAYGKPSAHTEKINMLAEDLLRSGEAKNPVEARMMAHAEASYKTQQRPEEAARDFYVDMLEALMPDSGEMAYKSPEERQQVIEEAKMTARELTEDYRDRYLSGYNGEGSGLGYRGGDRGGAEGEAEQAGQPAPAGQDAPAQRGSYEDAVQILRSRADDPQIRQFFDERYGPGAAEAALNGS